MSSMTNYYETEMLNTMRGITAAAPSVVYLALLLSNPTETGAAGTEASYTGYARQAMTFSAPATSGNAVSIQNSAQIEFPTPPGASGTVTYAAIMDAATGGNMLVYKQLSNTIVLTSEVSPRFAAGDVVLTMSGGNLDNSFKSKILSYLRGINVTGFSPYIALYTGDPSANGAELSGSGYARLALTFDEPEEQVSGQMEIKNTNSAQSAASTGWGTWAYTVIMDAQTGGARVASKSNLGSYAMDNGARAYVDVGKVIVSLN